MKRIPFIITILLFQFSNAFAQGDLQFNKVKLISSSDTVPQGKVWKVESIMKTSDCTGATSSSATYVKINNQIIVVTAPAFVSGNTVGLENTKLPFWLPEGSIIAPYCSISAYSGFISIIEYNIIQN